MISKNKKKITKKSSSYLLAIVTLFFISAFCVYTIAAALAFFLVYLSFIVILIPFIFLEVLIKKVFLKESVNEDSSTRKN